MDSTSKYPNGDPLRVHRRGLLFFLLFLFSLSNQAQQVDIIRYKATDFKLKNIDGKCGITFRLSEIRRSDTGVYL